MHFHRSVSILASKGEGKFLAKMAKELPLKTTMSHIQVCQPQDIKKDHELLHINGTFSVSHQFQCF